MLKISYHDTMKELEVSRKTVFSLEAKIMTLEGDLFKAKSFEDLYKEL